MLFGHGPSGPDLLLTERAHDMRSHPGQVSFPGGSIDQRDASAAAAALREAEEETGVDPSGVEVFASLPELWLPPSNFAVTPVLAWWREEKPGQRRGPARGARRAAGADRGAARPPAPDLGAPPLRLEGPAFLIGEDKDLILWGFTAGIIARLFDFVGWTQPWDASQMRDLPEHADGAPRGVRSLAAARHELPRALTHPVTAP